jgi:hypothetical protein
MCTHVPFPAAHQPPDCSNSCLPQISDTDSDASSLDSDEAALDYEAELEEQLEEAYASYLSRKGKRAS